MGLEARAQVAVGKAGWWGGLGWEGVGPWAPSHTVHGSTGARQSCCCGAVPEGWARKEGAEGKHGPALVGAA